jgi:PAS domain S-box-containing protein
MNSENATREQLIREISDLRQRLAGLERLESKREKSEEEGWGDKDHYRDLVENSRDLICTHDLEGKVLSLNQTAIKLLGYDPSVLLGRNIRDFLGPQFRNAFDTYLADIRKNGITRGLMRVQTRTGEKRIWEYHNTLRTEGVAAPIVRGMAHDVTDLKRAEQALKRSEEAAQKLAQESEIIAEIGRIIGSTLKIEEVYERFAEEARKLIPFDRIIVSLNNPDEGTAMVTYASGVAIEGRKIGDVYPLRHSGNDEVMRTRAGLLVQPETEGELEARFSTLLPTFHSGLRSMLTFPLISANQVIGALHFRSKQSKAYGERELKLGERIANQIAGAIANAHLFAERKKAEAEREKLILTLQKALSEVKALSGLLPICSSCKRIRDDRGYWNQIEAYIRDHSEANFSHSICPECTKTLYPEFLKK